MKYYTISLLLAFVVVACASKLPSSEHVQLKLENEFKPNEAETEIQAETAARNKRGLLYSAYSAPYAAAYAYPYTASYSYPYAYSAPYVYRSAYYPSYYSSYVLG